MDSKPLLRADLVTGLLLVIFGAWVIWQALGMPRFEARGVNPWSVPGLVPGLSGAVVMLLGAILSLRSLRAGALGSWREARKDGHDSAARLRLATCFGLCIGYAALLVGRVPFSLATFAFILIFISWFEWRRGDTTARRLTKLAIAAVIAGVAALAISLLFDRVFLVRLP